MKKLLLLIRVLRRCGRAEKDTQAESAHTGSISALMTPVLGVLLAVGMFFAGRWLAQHQDTMGSVESIFNTIMVLGCLISFFLAIPQVINQLYMSNDLDVLITLPLTDMQIVAARLASVSTLPMLLCCGLVIPCGLGFGITAGGMDAMFWIGVVLSAPMLALCMVAAAAVLIILLMRVFRFIRNRNLLSVLSTLLMFALSMGYVMMNNSNAIVQADKTFVILSNALSGVGKLIPVIDQCLRCMTGGGIVPLLIAVGITAAAVLVVMLVARLCYFSAALGMQDAAAGKGGMTDAQLRKSVRATGLRKALRRRELRTILRTPSLITNGYLYSIVMPVAMLVPVAVTLYRSINEELEKSGVSLGLAEIRAMIADMNMTWYAWTLMIIGLVLLMTTTAVALSVLSRGLISREGKDYSTLKALPVPMRTIVMIKRDLALMFNGISGVLFPVIAVIAGVALQLMPAWTIAVALIESVAVLVFMVDLCCLFGVKKPNLNWEAESDACKNNVPGLIALMVCLVVVIGGMVVLGEIEVSTLPLLTGILCAVPIVLAIVFDILLRREAGRMAERI